MEKALLHAIGSAILAGVCVLSGCATYPVDPEPAPVFTLPETFSAGAASIDDGAALWWQTFSDSALDALIAQALEGNLSLAQAQARIARAHALLRQARALPRPTLDMDGGLSREWRRIVHREDTGEGRDPTREAFQGLAGGNGADGDTGDMGNGGGGTIEPAGGDDEEFDRDSWETAYDLGLLFRWELDFWGRLRNAARAQAEAFTATVLDYEALRLLLSAQVAEAYYQAMEQRLQLALLDAQRESAVTYLELLELRFLQGSASSVDLLQQRGQVAEIEAEVPVARAQLGLLENRLDVLVGTPPDGQPRTATPGEGLPTPGTLEGIAVPASLLVRRPDLQAAQRRVVAADYTIAVAIAERLPQITLDGSLILDGTGEQATLTALSGLGLFQPLLDWGRRRAAVDAARATFEESLLAFSEAYLLAIEEVETTLWQEARQRELVAALERRAEILRSTLQQTRLRYSQGVTDYLPVLTAQQELQEVERELLRQQRVLVSLRIQLHRAVGGPTNKPEEAPAMAAG